MPEILTHRLHTKRRCRWHQRARQRAAALSAATAVATCIPAARLLSPSLSLTPSPTTAGWLFTYYNSKKTDERKAQIERINAQVGQLYGPLLACVHASRSAYAAMVRQHSPDGTVQGFVQALQAHPEGPEGEAYRCVSVCKG
jgi:hypothetical protein